MQLDEAYAVEITEVVECVDSSEGQLKQMGRMLPQNINSTVLQTARRHKTEVERGTRYIKDTIAEKIKESGEG